MDLKSYKIVAEAEHKARTLIHDLATEFKDDKNALIAAVARAATHLKNELEAMLPPSPAAADPAPAKVDAPTPAPEAPAPTPAPVDPAPAEQNTAAETSTETETKSE